ncbi:hypothetical protein DFJ58DRAFT_839966 [Suillus subalutaceus]|uniref:uncharacterized protein n=1 Tax=Suillus subalutaceus TaxID=48586 RepID=UPI001B8805A4|nr:uncharacterized protein DFJ58DRAFT_839966 [Suillus subalutaceus]KAG1860275.1 hypothetical protein DFJ58DRAFT_839966 [Suillus subalutaceus]
MCMSLLVLFVALFLHLLHSSFDDLLNSKTYGAKCKFVPYTQVSDGSEIKQHAVEQTEINRIGSLPHIQHTAGIPCQTFTRNFHNVGPDAQTEPEHNVALVDEAYAILH